MYIYIFYRFPTPKDQKQVIFSNVEKKTQRKEEVSEPWNNCCKLF